MTAAYRWFLDLSSASLIPDNLTAGDVAIWAITIPIVCGLIASGIVLGVVQWWVWHKARRARAEADIVAQCGEGLR